MLQFIFLLIISFAFGRHQQIEAQISHIDYAQNKNEHHLLFLSSGEVIKVPQKKHKYNLVAIEKNNPNQWYLIQIDQKKFLISIRSMKNKTDGTKIRFMNNFLYDYIPSTIKSIDEARNLHRMGKRNSKESQCFNRAMIWSYEWWKKYQIRSMKIFIFFTRNYIRKYNFEWWFHIAPYLHVFDGEQIKERVMDLKYTSRPTPIKQWTDIFMKNNSNCLVITKYSDYADYPYHGDCFILRTHMYTYQPADLQMYESWNYIKDQFNMNEIKGAYKEAFDIDYLE